MFNKKDIQMGFSDGYVERCIRENTSFKQINLLIDWIEIEKKIEEFAVSSCFTDKGYQVPDNVILLQSPIKGRKVKNRIMHKAYKNKPLTGWQKEYNHLISKQRWVVERTFGGMRRWFGCGRACYTGLAKTHTQHLLEVIAYNLYRAPWITISNSVQ